MRRASVLVLIATVACGGTGSTKPTAAPEPLAHALSGLAAQHVVVLPAYGVRIAPDLGWADAIGRPGDVERTLDADILEAFDERGLRKAWIFPAQLEANYRRNASYATDPYALAEEPLRAPRLAAGDRLAEPLASQLRTLIALNEDARLIVAPVDFQFERAGAGGRGRLRIVLIDPRYSTIDWVGEITSDPQPAFSPAISAGIASNLANIVAAP